MLLHSPETVHAALLTAYSCLVTVASRICEFRLSAPCCLLEDLTVRPGSRTSSDARLLVQPLPRCCPHPNPLTLPETTLPMPPLVRSRSWSSRSEVRCSAYQSFLFHDVDSIIVTDFKNTWVPPRLWMAPSYTDLMGFVDGMYPLSREGPWPLHLLGVVCCSCSMAHRCAKRHLRNGRR